MRQAFYAVFPNKPQTLGESIQKLRTHSNNIVAFGVKPNSIFTTVAYENLADHIKEVYQSESIEEANPNQDFYNVVNKMNSGMNSNEDILQSQEVQGLRDFMRSIFSSSNSVSASTDDAIEFPIGVLISTLSVFIMGALLAYFYVIRKEQSKKYDRETFIFTVDADKNNYTKKVKFLDQQDLTVSKVW